jgi:hypothetical protein
MFKKNAIKKRLKKIIFDIKNYIPLLIYRFIKKPIQEKKERKLVEEAKKDLIKNFEKSFNVNHKEILKLNSVVNTDFSLSDRKRYLNEKLKEGAKSLVSYTNKSPMFYEPEIINIHNEFNELSETPTYKDIIQEENQLNSQRLREQEYIIRRENYPKEKRLNLLNKRFGIFKK